MTYIEEILCPSCKNTYKSLCFHHTLPDEPDAPIFITVLGCSKGIQKYETYTGCGKYKLNKKVTKNE
jgi:hypothetical protein